AVEECEQELLRRERELERLAGELADQRTVLAEQFARLAAAQRAWRDEGLAVVGEMESLAGDLANGREQLEARARAVAPAEARLRQGLAELARERARLDAEQARLRAAELAGPGRLEQERRALEARSVELARREQALSELCRRWARRRREELERLRGELARW